MSIWQADNASHYVLIVWSTSRAVYGPWGSWLSQRLLCPTKLPGTGKVALLYRWLHGAGRQIEDALILNTLHRLSFFPGLLLLVYCYVSSPVVLHICIGECNLWHNPRRPELACEYLASRQYETSWHFVESVSLPAMHQGRDHLTGFYVTLCCSGPESSYYFTWIHSVGYPNEDAATLWCCLSCSVLSGCRFLRDGCLNVSVSIGIPLHHRHSNDQCQSKSDDRRLVAIQELYNQLYTGIHSIQSRS